MPRYNVFSNSDMTDMIAVYCQEQFNGGAAARRYVELYPNRRQPNRKLFQKLFQRLRENGSFRVIRHAGRPSVRTVEDVENILERIEENPEISIRRLSAATAVPRTNIHGAIRTQLLHPHHHTNVKNFLLYDFQLRLNFCRWLCNEQNDNPSFFGQVLFTDEATFTCRGVSNMASELIALVCVILFLF